MRAGLLVVLLAMAATADAQPRISTENGPVEPRFRLGVRAGAVAVENEAFETVYGRTAPIVGADGSVALGRRWSVRLSGDVTRTSAQLHIPVPNPPGDRPDVELTAFVTHASILRSFSLAPEWIIRGGIGPTYAAWREETDFDSNSGSSAGAHASAELVYRSGEWELGGSIMYWSVPDAFPESGLADALNDQNFGGLQLTLTAAWSFGEK